MEYAGLLHPLCFEINRLPGLSSQPELWFFGCSRGRFRNLSGFSVDGQTPDIPIEMAAVAGDRVLNGVRNNSRRGRPAPAFLCQERRPNTAGSFIGIRSDFGSGCIMAGHAG